MAPSSAQRPAPPWYRRFAGAFTDRLGLKLTAVFLAVVLWLVVNAKEPQSELVSVRFVPVLLDSSLVLRDPIPQVQAIVAGSPKELIKLSSTPAVVRREISADAPDTLLLDLHPGDVALPSGVDVVVRDIQPRSLVLRFEPTWTRRVAVSAAAVQVTGGAVDSTVHAEFEPTVVQLSGPRHVVARMTTVRTVPTTLPYPDSLAHLVDIDTTGFNGVRVRPAQVKVHLVSGAVVAGPGR